MASEEMKPPSEDLLLYRLDEMTQQLRDLRAGQQELREAVAGLRVRSGLWGAVSGAVPAIAALLWWLLKREVSR